MDPHPLIDRQHEVLRCLKQAIAERSQAETEAKALLYRTREVEAKALADVRGAADELITKARAVHDAAQSVLRERKWEAIVHDVSPLPTTPAGLHRNPQETMAKCVSRAEYGLRKLQDTKSSIGSIVGGLALTLFTLCVAADLVSNSNNVGDQVVSLGITGGLFLLGLGLIWWGVSLDRPRIRESYAAVLQAVADAEYWREQWTASQGAIYASRIEQATSRYHEVTSTAEYTYESKMSEIRSQLVELVNEANALSPSWDGPAWNVYRLSSAPPQATAIGKIEVHAYGEDLSAPALFLFPPDRALLVETSAPGRAIALGAIQSLLLRFIATVPPGKLHLTFIDPIGLGQSVAPFMHLADYDEALVTGRAWTEPQHIEQRLADLTEHMENVIQKYLRNQFATIEEYNAHAGEVAEPYRIVVVFDFPASFSEAAARRLVSIAQNGPRCGVYAVILADTEKPLPYGFSMADLERSASVIAWDGQHFVWQDEDFRDYVLELDAPPPSELFDRILKTVGEAAKEASKVEVPFARIAPPPEQWWTEDSAGGLSAPLGPAGARRIQHLELGKGTAQHVLIAGKTGSGKSTLLHVLITNLALAYSPEEVELYLVDFKKGVEFKTYALHQLPHARVVAIESEREFGLSVLHGLDAELKHRGDLFRSAGVDGLGHWRQETGGRLPRILLLVDEFQEFFTEDDATASQAAQILDRLVRQGRAFGIHVLLGSQTLAGAYTLARSTIGQMAVRIALQCSETDSRLILGDDNPAARLLSRPGEAIYNAANGMIEGNNRFQVAWLPDDERDRYLARVQALAQQRGYRPPQPQIVFEGNAPAIVESNRQLQDLLMVPGWQMPLRSPAAWLGEPVAIRDPIAALFRRQSASNLLVVGQNDEIALGLMAVALVSLAAQIPPSSTAPFYVLDFGAVDTPNADFLSRLVSHLPHQVKIGRRRQLPAVIAELEAEVQRRLDTEDGTRYPIYLFLYGLQRARDLRQDEVFSFSPPSDEQVIANPAQQFTTILREGADLGVHTLVWCDTLTNLNRTLDRRAQREFAMRVVLQMSAEDSANLVDVPAASKLGPYRALFYSEEEGRLEKFRPYAVPPESWLEWAGQQLREKG